MTPEKEHEAKVALLAVIGLGALIALGWRYGFAAFCLGLLSTAVRSVSEKLEAKRTVSVTVERVDELTKRAADAIRSARERDSARERPN